ncbi:hypothetical protein SAY86_004551 [Trapa natans]|uniref:LOB domain-containing protein n=1 Tax=Trapa natans TaxID=22666 RepID=A0AAN7MGC0_TRANT|nr:hypothetical protein SAY86_004551 [Trapa natans]
MHNSSTSTYNSPCAACKFLRRKCLPGCLFAPYFPPEEPQKFANVHRIFGASNVTKLLNEVPPDQRDDAVSSLAFEAEARVRDPVYGCVGAISFLQRQIESLQEELDAANADLIRYTGNVIDPSVVIASMQQQQPAPSAGFARVEGDFPRHSGFDLPYPPLWSTQNPPRRDRTNERGDIY